jgi:hypothetical protein
LTDLAARARTSLFRSSRVSLTGVVIASGLMAWTGFLWRMEPDPHLFFPVAAFFILLSAVGFAVTARRRFATLFAMTLFLWVYVAAAAKFALVAMKLHVYDVIFYGFSTAPVEFFFSAYRERAYALTALSVAVVVALTLVWRAERPSILLARHRVIGLVGGGAMAVASVAPLTARNADFFNEDHYSFSSFLSSFGDLPQLLRFNGIIEQGPGPEPTTTVAAPIDCRPTSTPPDIVLFLNESAMPPGVYDKLVYPDELKPLFQSADGRIHPLRVETFGGGTWLTDFSVLTGLSTRSFGNLRNFAANFMNGRLHHSLPQYLRACGYETSLIYPASAGFAGVGRFYEAIGFERVIDTSVHHASDQRQRDAFYLGEVAKIIEAKTDGPRKPRFVVVSSMSTHSPWDFRFAPEAVREGETTRWNEDPEFDEYLWRLTLAKRDRDAFRAELAARVPSRKILYVDYGDHQPALAKVPLDNALAIADEGRSWQLDPTSKAFETYFAVKAQGFEPRWPDSYLPMLEAAHLPTIIAQAAGLPLDAVYKRRARLLEVCKGLYATCPDRAAVLNFQRWLVSTGYLAQR